MPSSGHGTIGSISIAPRGGHSIIGSITIASQALRNGGSARYDLMLNTAIQRQVSERTIICTVEDIWARQ